LGEPLSPDPEVLGVRIKCLSVLLLDVHGQRGRGHHPVAAAAARHHRGTVSVEEAAAAAGRRGHGRGGCRLLELLLVDLTLLGSTVLEPDLHLRKKKAPSLLQTDYRRMLSGRGLR